LLAVATVQANTTEPAGPPSRSQRHPQREPQRRLAVAGAAAAALVAFAGVGAVSGDAVPGDALYSVKRTREAAQLALARSDVSQGQLHLRFARTRLTEAATVRRDESELRRVLDDMDADTRTGMRELSGAAVKRQDRAPLDAVDEFLAAQRRQLIALIGDLPGTRRLRAVDSLALLEQVRERSGSLRASLLCTVGYTGAHRSDELGPLPRRCAAPPGAVQPRESRSPGGPHTLPGGQRGTVPETTPKSFAPAGPSAAPVPGLPGVPAGLDSPTPPPTPPAQPTPASSGGTQGPLGSVAGTVGGVVGGVLGGGLGG